MLSAPSADAGSRSRDEDRQWLRRIPFRGGGCSASEGALVIGARRHPGPGTENDLRETGHSGVSSDGPHGLDVKALELEPRQSRRHTEGEEKAALERLDQALPSAGISRTTVVTARSSAATGNWHSGIVCAGRDRMRYGRCVRLGRWESGCTTWSRVFRSPSAR